jgi:hypothetical protein
MSKIEQFWRDATADDAARVMKGETIEARFRDSESVKWVENGCSLAGWCAGVWTSSSGLPWVFCQVYDPPQWWLDKPDPGPGWRLLGKFPDEPKLATDEGWFPGDATWCPVEDNGIQLEGYWYRRRIEVEPEPRHYVLRVGDTVETPNGHLIKAVSPETCQVQYKLKAGFTATLPNGQTITATEKGYKVTQ